MPNLPSSAISVNNYENYRADDMTGIDYHQVELKAHVKKSIQYSQIWQILRKSPSEYTGGKNSSLILSIVGRIAIAVIAMLPVAIPVYAHKPLDAENNNNLENSLEIHKP